MKATYEDVISRRTSFLAKIIAIINYQYNENAFVRVYVNTHIHQKPSLRKRVGFQPCVSVSCVHTKKQKPFENFFLGQSPANSIIQ
jgi:hypothetical protein